MPEKRAAVREVEIWAGEGKAFFRGVVQCGSVWVCPVCAGKVSEKRRKELQGCIDNALNRSAQMGVSLVTLTVRHGVGDVLADLLPKFSKALRRLKSGRPYKKLCADFGIVGEARALEVTHGKNGWHPHTHAVTFSNAPMLDNRSSFPQYREENKRTKLPGRTVGIVAPISRHRLTQFKRRLFALWYRACKAEGLPLPTYRHGVDVRGAKYAADYVAKWGFADELVKSQRKKAGQGGRNPWQLLDDARAGDKRAAWLFREYAASFRGRRQLFWSKIMVGGKMISLKKYLTDADEITDQEAIEETDADAMTAAACVAVLDADTWACVLKGHARAHVLEAAREGTAALCGLLNRLRAEVGLYGRTLEPREEWAV